MTDRIPLDHLTSDQYDALHARIAALEALLTEAEEHNEQTCEAVTRAERAEADRRVIGRAAVDYQQRTWDAEAALARVRRVADLIEAGAPWTASRADTAARIRDALDTERNHP